MFRNPTTALALVLSFGTGGAWAECQWVPGNSHADYRACLLREAIQADAQVDALVASTRQRISGSDEDASMKQRALETLQASADSFRRYRSKQCEFEASTAAGGNSAGDLRALCDIALDNAYIEHMKSVHGFGGP